MKRYLFDTNHVSAALKNERPLTDRLIAAGEDEFGVCVPSLGELWFMVYNSARIAENSANLRTALAQYKRWPFSSACALQFGKIKAELRRTGLTIGDVDVQISAIAMVNDLILLSDDADFQAVPGLKLENWIR